MANDYSQMRRVEPDDLIQPTRCQCMTPESQHNAGGSVWVDLSITDRRRQGSRREASMDGFTAVRDA